MVIKHLSVGIVYDQVTDNTVIKLQKNNTIGYLYDHRKRPKL